MLEVKGRASMVWYWAAVGLVISALGWWLMDWVEDLGKLGEILAVSLMISGVVIVGLGIYKAVDKRAILVVDQKGVLDRTSYPSRQLAWADIRGFRLVPVGGRAPLFLAIDLVNPEELIGKALFGSAALLETMQEKYGTPCVITLRALDTQPHALLARLNEALNRIRR